VAEWHISALGGIKTMRRSVSLLVVTFSVFVVSLLAMSFSANAGGNCQDKLVGNSYECNYVNSEGSSGTECIAFGTGALSDHFDAGYNSADEYGCACDPKGSSKSPSFDASSNTYQCTSPGSPAYLLSGKINGKKLTEQGFDSAGFQYVETCELRSSPCP
jgi:hypothetical protein